MSDLTLEPVTGGLTGMRQNQILQAAGVIGAVAAVAVTLSWFFDDVWRPFIHTVVRWATKSGLGWLSAHWSAIWDVVTAGLMGSQYGNGQGRSGPRLDAL